MNGPYDPAQPDRERHCNATGMRHPGPISPRLRRAEPGPRRSLLLSNNTSQVAREVNLPGPADGESKP